MQIDAAGKATEVFGTKHYSNGYCWSAKLDLTREEKGPPASNIGLYLRCALPPGTVPAGSGLVGAAAVGPVVNLNVSVAAAWQGGEPIFNAGGLGRVEGRTARPLSKPDGAATLTGFPRYACRPTMPDGSLIHRGNFRSPGCPIVHNAKLLVKFTLESLTR
jgi:hypothetical protein